MAINQEFHKAVIEVTTAKNKDAVAFGFSSIADAIYFVSEQVTEEVEKKDAIVDALTDEGYDLDGVRYRIFDIEAWLDLYEGDDDDED
ncbi:hypothetical protein [Streptomyces rochei]|uniref:hypothetical protein n=1 Tax=Streptomyces rochei TaxID=1928 RepID=UPI0036A98A28